MTDLLLEAIREIDNDRVLAHQVLFSHRHKNLTPAYHRDLINYWHGKGRHEGFMVFRGGGKSTIAEEGYCVGALLRDFRNALLIGSSLDRACERLAAIRHEFEQNEMILELFGDVRGSSWGDTELVLSSGVRILALGRGQALRGVKWLEARPDHCLIDDIEVLSDVRNPEAKRNLLAWVLKELIPAMDVTKYKARCLATPLDPESLPYQLERAGWRFHRYPVEYQDEHGIRRATWPDRVPLEEIDKIKATFERVGALSDYNAEYMCTAETASEKTFKGEMFRTEVQVRTWQNVYCMFDPARTVSRTSASTGYAAWSWIADRLIVWDAWGKTLLPDEIVSSVFQSFEDFHPAIIGVEEDGLNEWLLQPIRQEQIKRGVTVPYKAIKAPKGKLDFIRGLQPFFNAREIVFAKDLPELKSQFLSFPTGRIDAPNALAYALKMRPGAPIYDNFSGKNIGEDMVPSWNRPSWLCLNATPSLVTGVLVQQFEGGALRIFADWVREGDPGQVAADIIKLANEEAGKQVRVIAGPQHFERYTNFGLKQAITKQGIELRRGSTTLMGQQVIRDLLTRDIKGFPGVVVSRETIWTANAFAGGYARAMAKQGILADYAEENVYRTLMEGLECFAGLSKLGTADDDNSQLVYDHLPTGRAYLTARR